MDSTHLIIYAATFVAGFLNATTGGGGLLQVPTLMLVLPGTPLPAILGTAKLAGVPGIAAALTQYRSRLPAIWPLVMRAGAAEIPFSVLGARVATVLNPALARPMVLVILAAMSLQVLLTPNVGEHLTPRPVRLTGPTPWLVGALVGFYEGFFGAGSSTILIMVFVSWCGLDLMAASMASAAVTFAGAGAALITFALAGSVLIPLAFYMIIFNIAGAVLGARLITLRGNAAIRRLLGLVLLGLIVKLVWDSIQA